MVAIAMNSSKTDKRMINDKKKIHEGHQTVSIRVEEVF